MMLDCFIDPDRHRGQTSQHQLGHSVGLLQDVLDPREAAIPSTALAQRQHEPWFPATLVPLKVQKSGGFRGPGSSLFILYGGIISLRCLQSLYFMIFLVG